MASDGGSTDICHRAVLFLHNPNSNWLHSKHMHGSVETTCTVISLWSLYFSPNVKSYNCILFCPIVFHIIVMKFDTSMLVLLSGDNFQWMKLFWNFTAQESWLSSGAGDVTHLTTSLKCNSHSIWRFVDSVHVTEYSTQQATCAFLNLFHASRCYFVVAGNLISANIIFGRQQAPTKKSVF